METIKITKEIALTVQKDSIVKVDKKQLELLANYKDCYILVEDEEPKGEVIVEDEEPKGEVIVEDEEPKGEVKKLKIKKEAKK